MLSLCDRLWHPDMTEAEALELMEKVRGSPCRESRLLITQKHDAYNGSCVLQSDWFHCRALQK